jgi:hypothetical protein
MICLTFDTDWMTEDSLSRFLREFPLPGECTFFSHKAFQCLMTDKHEIGPHPFIDNLDNWKTALQDLSTSLNMPVRGVRPHSCVFSHMVGVGLRELNFEYVSQANNMFQDNLRPFRHPWGVWELPIFYMDNMDFWMAHNWPESKHKPFSDELIKRAVYGEDLYVFDFHPIHVALNSRSHDDYQSVKNIIVIEEKSPFDYCFSGRGVRVFFVELCQEMIKAGNYSVTCGDALDRWALV